MTKVVENGKAFFVAARCRGFLLVRASVLQAFQKGKGRDLSRIYRAFLF